MTREGSMSVAWVDDEWARKVYLFITETYEERDLAMQMLWTGALA